MVETIFQELEILGNSAFENLELFDGYSAILTFSNNPSTVSLPASGIALQGVRRCTITNNLNLESFSFDSSSPGASGLETVLANNNPKLNFIEFGLSELTYPNLFQIDISNCNFSNFDVSAFTNLTQFNVTNNPLSCIQVAQEQLDISPQDG
jgi:hypothetical protein